MTRNKQILCGVLIFLALAVLLIILAANKRRVFNKIAGIYSLDDTSPFIDVSNRKCIKALKNSTDMIRKEVLSNMEHFEPIKGDLYFRSIIDDDKWSKIYLKWYSKSPRYAYDLFPETMRLIDDHPEIKLAMFSRLKPGTVIKPHKGPYRGCIRVHLGVITPNSPKCYIRVGGEPYYWKDNEIVAFDDTYIHEVKNESDQDRIILFLDIEREFSSKWVKNTNSFIMKHIASKTSRKNAKLSALYRED